LATSGHCSPRLGGLLRSVMKDQKLIRRKGQLGVGFPLVG
jgi:hypothetical protein